MNRFGLVKFVEIEAADNKQENQYAIEINDHRKFWTIVAPIILIHLDFIYIVEKTWFGLVWRRQIMV